MNAGFEDRLLTALLDEYEQLTTTEAPPSPVVTARTRRPRQRLVSAGAATIGIAAAAAAIVATPPAPTRSHPQGRTRTARARTVARIASRTTRSLEAVAAPHTVDVAYVVHGVQQALNANTDVLRELVHAPDGQTRAPTTEETWSRGGTDTTHTITLNPQGPPMTGALVTITPHRTISIVIDYATQSYTERTYPFGSDHPGPAPLPATPMGQAATLTRPGRHGAGDARGHDDRGTANRRSRCATQAASTA